MGRGSGGGRYAGVVARARQRGGVLDTGQLSKQEKADLREAVRAGTIVRQKMSGRNWYIGA